MILVLFGAFLVLSWCAFLVLIFGAYFGAFLMLFLMPPLVLVGLPEASSPLHSGPARGPNTEVILAPLRGKKASKKAQKKHQKVSFKRYMPDGRNQKKYTFVYFFLIFCCFLMLSGASSHLPLWRPGSGTARQ